MLSGQGQRFSLLSDERLSLALFICATGGERRRVTERKPALQPCCTSLKGKVEVEGKMTLCPLTEDMLIIRATTRDVQLWKVPKQRGLTSERSSVIEKCMCVVMK